MRRFAIALPLALAMCASSKVKLDAASNAWGDCIWQAVSQLDDGKSDPSSVALGISPRCGVLYNELTQLSVGQFFTEGGQANAQREMRAGEIRLITAAILTYRASKANRS